MPKTLPGRKRGGKYRGFFYRQERGWCAHDCGRMVPLRDSDGRPLKDPKLPQKLVREAHARWLMVCWSSDFCAKRFPL